MSTAVEQIESAILKLSAKELTQLTKWVLELDEQQWDKQIESDAATGKLDSETRSITRTGKWR
jgi:hypothetical protein